MRIVVTGASSYIARYVIIKLLEAGNEVLGISRTDPKINAKGFSFQECDLTEKIPNIGGGWDAIIHMAAQSLLNKHASEYFSSNLLLTHNVAKMAEFIKPKLVYYTSSYKIYGEIREKILDENSVRINPCLYGETKYYGEKLLEEVVPTLSVRMPGVLAKGSHGWLNNVHQQLTASEEIRLVSSPYNHIVHASDIATLFLKAMKQGVHESAQYNICASGLSTSFEVVSYMKESLGSRSNIVLKEKNEEGFVFSNQKVSGIHVPMDVLASIDLYLSEFK